MREGQPSPARRARLKIFFGAASGVGKTYAMLASAHRLVAEGVRVVVGTADARRRDATTDLLAGLPRLSGGELDVDAAILQRPDLILVDDLAHGNAPGARHPKRWQDVIELLDAGIDVHTTLDVQDLESLVDAVAQITGVRGQEIVPDTLLERADEIELIDVAAEELLERVAEGKVAVAEDRGNLLALRELALRKTAERVDVDVLAYRRAQRIDTTWPTQERLVVCVGPSPGSERLVRAARQLANSMRAPWHAVHVELTDAPPLSIEDRDRVDAHLTLAESLGASVTRRPGTSVAAGMLDFAREQNATRIVVGKPTHSRWRDLVRGSLLDTLIRGSGALEVHVIAPTDQAPPRPQPWLAERRLAAYATGLLLVTLAALLGVLAGPHLALPDDAMLFLFAIILAALRGRGPGIVAAAAAVVAYDFFFIMPRYTLSVYDVRYFMTFAVMFLVGTATGSLVARLRHAESAARERERRTATLLAFTAEAARASDIADVAAAVVRHVEEVLAAPASVLLPGPDGMLSAAAGLEPLAPQEIAVARWAHDHRRPAGRGTDTLPGARLLAVPLWVGDTSAGVVAVQIERARRKMEREASALLEGIARQAGVAIGRLRLASEAREAELRATAEELRSSLLSTVSHDLRTPLAIIDGTATTLRHAVGDAPAEQLEAIDTIIDEARRLGTILTNLLAITRVESGGELDRDWVPVEELVGSALARCEAALSDREVAITLAPEIGVLVNAPLIEQLLLNLLDNAAKHTPPRTAISISAAADAGGVDLQITDDGPGLPPGSEDQVFQKFFRGPHPRVAGAGLGLAVCRGIAIAHGGHITAHRRPEGGTSFHVWLPGGGPPVDAAASRA